MTEETQKNDLGSLSQAWSERVKGIRQMVQKGKQGDSVEPDTVNTVAPEDDLFTGTVHGGYSAQQIFAGDEEFYKNIENMSTSESQPSYYRKGPDHQERFMFTLKILIVSIILITCVVLSCGFLVGLLPLPSHDQLPTADSQRSVSVNIQAVSTATLQEPEILQDEDHPLSLMIAQDYYLQDNFKYAFAVYKKLHENLPKDIEKDGLRDFMKLQMALCIKERGEHEQAASLLKPISQSRFPIIRALADYYLCRLEMQKQQYFTARTMAYQTIALLDAADSQMSGIAELKRDCYFLAAEALTRQVFSLSDADSDLPTKLWPRFDAGVDLLAGFDEEELTAILDAGLQQLNKALLEPKVQACDTDGIRNWTVNCSGASIGEFMGQFSVKSGYDIHWSVGSEKVSIRDRSINLCMRTAADQDCVTVAAGCAGLLARIDENNMITVCDPTQYLYVSDQIAQLSGEAVSCWERFLLVYYDDPYLPNAHFAMAILKASQGLIPESLAECKMLANRFFRSDLAPAALMNSAKLKMALQDYRGAYNDLKDAAEQYPDYEKIDYARLSLADMAFKMGQDVEATKLYEKVYYLNNSSQSQSNAALAAGQLFYQNQDLPNAEKWLSRYVSLEDIQQDDNFYEACLLLGKTWHQMGKSELACNALRISLSGQLSREDYVEALNVLVQGYIGQQRYIDALSVLNETDSMKLSQEESVKMLLFKSRVLRELGLIEKSIIMLRDREEYLVDNRLKTEVGCELSDCYIEQEQWELAYKKLASLVETADPGPTTNRAIFKLAEVCLKLNKDDQAMNLCKRLLSFVPDDLTKRKTLELLATIYNHQKNYDRATLALLGQWQ